MHKCVAVEEGGLVFRKCYFDESWYSVYAGGGTLMMANRMMSTYVNALAGAGFVIERMVEETDEEIVGKCDEGDGFGRKARMLPVTFVVKARRM